MPVSADQWAAVGRRIAERREARGLTQRGLAAAVASYEREHGAAEGESECAVATIARYEQGVLALSVSRLCAIAEVLGTTAQAMLDGIL